MGGHVNGQAALAPPHSTPGESAHTARQAAVTQSLLDLLRAGHVVRFRALGGSMWPWIPAGSTVEITPSSIARLKVGTVGAYERRGKIVVHRVRRLEPDRVAFGGDAQPYGNLEWVASPSILGTARVIERAPLHVRRPTWHDLARLARAVWARWRR